jgi:hypothetical protein
MSNKHKGGWFGVFDEIKAQVMWDWERNTVREVEESDAENWRTVQLLVKTKQGYTHESGLLFCYSGTNTKDEATENKGVKNVWG